MWLFCFTFLLFININQIDVVRTTSIQQLKSLVGYRYKCLVNIKNIIWKSIDCVEFTKLMTYLWLFVNNILYILLSVKYIIKLCGKYKHTFILLRANIEERFREILT